MNAMLEKAFALHKTGDFARAESLYQAILEKDPHNAQALFLLGTLQCQDRRFEESLTFLQMALQINPSLDEAYNSLGNAYLGLNELDKAEEYYSKIALTDKKPNASALNNLGILREKQNRKKEASDFFAKAIRAYPLFLDAHLNLAQNHAAQARFSEAQKVCREALKIFPDNFSLWVQLGNIQKRASQFDKALESYQHALSLNPQNILVLNNLGIVFKDLNHLEKSLECYEKIELIGEPTVEILFNKGITLKEMGRFEDALACYDRALKQKPNLAEAYVNRAQILILLQDFKRAWPDYEWRLKTPGFEWMRAYIQPRWMGEPLKDKKILIYGEQGLGDEIFFSSCLKQVVSQASQTYLECHPKLVTLFEKNFPEAQVRARTDDGSSVWAKDKKIDYQIPVGSLNLYSPFPGEAYLKADAHKTAFWKSRLNFLGNKPKIGISWTSKGIDLGSSTRSKFSTEIDWWGDVLKNTQFDFINLQYGDTVKERKFIEREFKQTLHHWDDLDLWNDIDSVAALVSNLDLVISINTATAYLTGALGKKAWVILPYYFGPKAGINYTDAWFSTMQFFLQPSPGHWDGVIEKIGKKLSGDFL
ncbi:tetratricopeptide repeat protein [bacterium]|nr:tetratricopeptide repeat protein [bacterium]